MYFLHKETNWNAQKRAFYDFPSHPHSRSNSRVHFIRSTWQPIYNILQLFVCSRVQSWLSCKLMQIESLWPKWIKFMGHSRKSFAFDWFGTQKIEFRSKRDVDCFRATCCKFHLPNEKFLKENKIALSSGTFLHKFPPLSTISYFFGARKVLEGFKHFTYTLRSSPKFARQENIFICSCSSS